MGEDFNVQLYDVLGTGRESPNYSQTIVSKGRVKESIDFVAAKTVDLIREKDVYHSVQIMGKFRHENIVQFINWYITKTKLYVILEYCPGGSLLDLLERDVCLPESVIRIFSSDILSALHYIHHHGFIFHDLSPRNILLDECGLLKLNDFARATQIDDPIDFSTIDYEILEYLPPEALMDDYTAAFASDFYSLACLMYRMATGTTPFVSSDINELKDKILNPKFVTQKVAECSAEFNDFVLRCLSKDPFKRPTWKEVVNHPFWKDSLTDRLDDQFKNFSEKLLPPQVMWETRMLEQQQQNQQQQSVKPNAELSKSLRLSLIPKKEDISIKQSLENTADSAMNSVLNATNEAINVNDLIIKTPLFEPSTIVLNTNIESFPLSSTEGVSLPVTNAMLRSKPEEAISKVDAAFKGADRVKSKVPILSFLIEQAKVSEIASNLANSSLFPEIIDCAKSTKHPSLAAGFLLLYGTILKFATGIQDNYLTTDSISQLQVLSCSQQEKISRKAVSAIGQLATYIANGLIKIPMPSFVIPTILKALRSADEPIRHYALRTVANLLNYDYDIDQSTLENIFFTFDFGQSQFLTETFAIACGIFYTKYTASSNEFVVNLIKNFISRPSPTLQIIAIIIASAQNLVSVIKDGVISVFKNLTGEIRSKSFLAMCVLFKSNPAEFIEHSQKFFHILEKMQTESPNSYETVMRWSVEYCESIVDIVLETSNIDLLTIVYNGMQIRQISTRIWTPKFEKKIEKAIRNHTFNTTKSEVAIQIVQCALCYQLCDVSIVADMCRAINSQQATVRFAVVKLIADASSQKPFHAAVMAFIENNIMTQILPLLQDEDCIIDQTLRVLSNASIENPEILKQISKPSIVNLIFNSVCDNQAALELSTQLIASNEISIDCMVGNRFVPAIIGSLDKKENTESAIDLLLAALTIIEKKKNRRNLIKSINNLATMAPKMASLILDNPKAGQCLCLMTKIFTPQGAQNEVVIESAFNPFATALSTGFQKAEYSAVLSEVIRTFQWAVENSPPTRLKLKGASKLMNSLRKAAESGTDEIKQAAAACVKAVK